MSNKCKKSAKLPFNTSSKGYRILCVVLTLVVLCGFFVSSFFVGFGVRGCMSSNSSEEVVQLLADSSSSSAVYSYTSTERLLPYVSIVSREYNGSSVYNAYSFNTVGISFTFRFADSGLYLRANSSLGESSEELFLVNSGSSVSSSYRDAVMNTSFLPAGDSADNSYLRLAYSWNNVDFSSVGSSFPIWLSRMSINVGVSGGLGVMSVYINGQSFSTGVIYDFYDIRFYFNNSYSSYLDLYIPFYSNVSDHEFFNYGVFMSPILYFDSSSSDYSNGYNSGYASGFQAGSICVNSDSYSSGYDYGYKIGHADGVSSVNVNPLGIILNGADSFFKINLFGNVSLGLIFSLSFGILLFGLAIRLFFHG